jgi:hypothetical protein
LKSRAGRNGRVASIFSIGKPKTNGPVEWQQFQHACMVVFILLHIYATIEIRERARVSNRPGHGNKNRLNSRPHAEVPVEFEYWEDVIFHSATRLFFLAVAAN